MLTNNLHKFMDEKFYLREFRNSKNWIETEDIYWKNVNEYLSKIKKNIKEVLKKFQNFLGNIAKIMKTKFRSFFKQP